jgi:hypothetical protein
MSDEFAVEIAAMVMDNCSSHITRDVIGLLTEVRVRINTFTPHTAQIFPVLDETLFRDPQRHPR